MATDALKYYTTRISPQETQGHIMATLHRYGASGFGFYGRGTTREVRFHMPMDNGADREIIIPIDIERVRSKLEPILEQRNRGHKARVKPDPEQAERVAWRVLLDWIDAALLAVSVGGQTLEEAFMAHTVVTTTDGQRGRMVDYIATLQATSSAPNSLPGLGRPITPALRDRRLIGGPADAV